MFTRRTGQENTDARCPSATGALTFYGARRRGGGGGGRTAAAKGTSVIRSYLRRPRMAKPEKRPSQQSHCVDTDGEYKNAFRHRLSFVLKTAAPRDSTWAWGMGGRQLENISGGNLLSPTICRIRDIVLMIENADAAMKSGSSSCGSSGYHSSLNSYGISDLWTEPRAWNKNGR